MRIAIVIAGVMLLVAMPALAGTARLAWPIGCIPGLSCNGSVFYIGYPDIDGDGKAFDGGPPGYPGHTGTDITISSVEEEMPVFAAADGEVLLVSGGKADQCTDILAVGCQQGLRPGDAEDERTVQDPGPLCIGAEGCFSWGFDAGNFILMKHGDAPILYTFYAHLRKGSISVTAGQSVRAGEKIAEVGSSGDSLAPHLHFGVFLPGPGDNILVDPWSGEGGAGYLQPLWQHDPPYKAEVTVVKKGEGDGVVTCDGGRNPCTTGHPLSVIPGSTMTFKAMPFHGSRFVGWEGACSGSMSLCSATIGATTWVMAVFAIDN